jgi:CRISPR-associated protein Cmr4
MEAKLLLLHAYSPLHAGTGQSVDVIDLPVAREKATGIPFLPGSTVKGVFRDACGDDDKCLRIFGPKTGNAEEYAGSVNFTDARLLLLPVRSLRGVFAWVTSPLLLRRLKRDAQDTSLLAFSIPVPADESSCHVTNDGCVLNMDVGSGQKVILEDLPLGFAENPDVSAWAGWLGQKLFPGDVAAQNDLKSRLCVVADDTLSFLLETATEISARIHIDDDKKTVAKGQLWYEEALPAETVLVSLVVAAEVKSKPKEVFNTVKELSAKTLQFGGKATVGRGLCKAVPVWETMP